MSALARVRTAVVFLAISVPEVRGPRLRTHPHHECTDVPRGVREALLPFVVAHAVRIFRGDQIYDAVPFQTEQVLCERRGRDPRKRLPQLSNRNDSLRMTLAADLLRSDPGSLAELFVPDRGRDRDRPTGRCATDSHHSLV